MCRPGLGPQDWCAGTSTSSLGTWALQAVRLVRQEVSTLVISIIAPELRSLINVD